MPPVTAKTITDTDPRGPSRRIALVTPSPTGGPTLLTLDGCGHVVERVNHFSYQVGNWERCFTCRRLINARPKEAP